MKKLTRDLFQIFVFIHLDHHFKQAGIPLVVDSHPAFGFTLGQNIIDQDVGLDVKVIQKVKFLVDEFVNPLRFNFSPERYIIKGKVVKLEINIFLVFA